MELKMEHFFIIYVAPTKGDDSFNKFLIFLCDALYKNLKVKKRKLYLLSDIKIEYCSAVDKQTNEKFIKYYGETFKTSLHDMKYKLDGKYSKINRF